MIYTQKDQIVNALEKLKTKTGQDAELIFTGKAEDRGVQFFHYDGGPISFNFPIYLGILNQEISIVKVTPIEAIPAADYRCEDEILSPEEVQRLIAYLNRWNLPYARQSGIGRSPSGETMCYLADIGGDLTLPPEHIPDFIEGIFQQVYRVEPDHRLEITGP